MVLEIVEVELGRGLCPTREDVEDGFCKRTAMSTTRSGSASIAILVKGSFRASELEKFGKSIR